MEFDIKILGLETIEWMIRMSCYEFSRLWNSDKIGIHFYYRLRIVFQNKMFSVIRFAASIDVVRFGCSLVLFNFYFRRLGLYIGLVFALWLDCVKLGTDDYWLLFKDIVFAQYLDFIPFILFFQGKWKNFLTISKLELSVK